jgi:hypothetical protein
MVLAGNQVRKPIALEEARLKAQVRLCVLLLEENVHHPPPLAHAVFGAKTPVQHLQLPAVLRADNVIAGNLP